MPFASPEDTAAQYGLVREAARKAGRDPDSLVYSVALTMCAGRDDTEVARRAAAIGRDEAQLRATGLAGTPDQVLEVLDRYRSIGASRVYLQFLDLSDLGQLELIAQEVAGRVG